MNGQRERMNGQRERMNGVLMPRKATSFWFSENTYGEKMFTKIFPFNNMEELRERLALFPHANFANVFYNKETDQHPLV